MAMAKMMVVFTIRKGNTELNTVNNHQTGRKYFLKFLIHSIGRVLSTHGRIVRVEGGEKMLSRRHVLIFYSFHYPENIDFNTVSVNIHRNDIPGLLPMENIEHTW